MSIDQTEKLTPLAGQTSRLSIKRIRHWLDLQHLRAQVRRERRALSQLPDSLLADMGIDRAEALQESRRPWRDVPQQRLRHQLQQYCLINLD